MIPPREAAETRVQIAVNITQLYSHDLTPFYEW